MDRQSDVEMWISGLAPYRGVFKISGQIVNDRGWETFHWLDGKTVHVSYLGLSAHETKKEAAERARPEIQKRVDYHKQELKMMQEFLTELEDA